MLTVNVTVTLLLTVSLSIENYWIHSWSTLRKTLIIAVRYRIFYIFPLQLKLTVTLASVASRTRIDCAQAANFFDDVTLASAIHSYS
jgi:hypothetical protein